MATDTGSGAHGMTRQAQRYVTERLDANDSGVARAAAHLRAGRLVAFPTETVYGLGGDASDANAVAAIYAAKGRPASNPLIVHVPDAETAARIGDLSGVRPLTDRFWPGPLTVVVPLRPQAELAPAVTGGRASVALRVPGSPLARRLIEEAGVPVAAPSANPSGRISPTTADHVLSRLDGRIAAVLDDGPTAFGLESTILASDTAGLRLLREGALTAEEIGATLIDATAATMTPEAPGQLASHYAPTGTLRLFATEAREGETLIGFGDVKGDLSLSPSGDLLEAAASLYAVLHRMDRESVARIAVAPIPDVGVGRAINDRLRRAAAPRPA